MSGKPTVCTNVQCVLTCEMCVLMCDGILAFHLQVPLFQGMAPAEIESLAVVLTEKVYRPKSVVYYQGNEVEDLFFIQRGHVKVLIIFLMIASCCPTPSGHSLSW